MENSPQNIRPCICGYFLQCTDFGESDEENPRGDDERLPDVLEVEPSDGVTTSSVI